MLKVLAVIARSVLKSGEARELLKKLFDWVKKRRRSKRQKKQPQSIGQKTDWKVKAGLITGLLVLILMGAGLLWMHQRLSSFEERLSTIEERQK